MLVMETFSMVKTKKNCVLFLTDMLNAKRWIAAAAVPSHAVQEEVRLPSTTNTAWEVVSCHLPR